MSNNNTMDNKVRRAIDNVFINEELEDLKRQILVCCSPGLTTKMESLLNDLHIKSICYTIEQCNNLFSEAIELIEEPKTQKTRTPVLIP